MCTCLGLHVCMYVTVCFYLFIFHLFYIYFTFYFTVILHLFHLYFTNIYIIFILQLLELGIVFKENFDTEEDSKFHLNMYNGEKINNLALKEKRDREEKSKDDSIKAYDEWLVVKNIKDQALKCLSLIKAPMLKTNARCVFSIGFCVFIFVYLYIHVCAYIYNVHVNDIYICLCKCLFLVMAPLLKVNARWGCICIYTYTCVYENIYTYDYIYIYKKCMHDCVMCM